MTNVRKSLIPYVAFVLLAEAGLGCTPTGRYVFTPTAGRPQSASSPPDCVIQITATAPASGYEEIGILELDHAVGVTSAREFEGRVRGDVCKAGGHLVVTQVSSGGHYIRAAVMRRTSS